MKKIRIEPSFIDGYFSVSSELREMFGGQVHYENLRNLFEELNRLKVSASDRVFKQAVLMSTAISISFIYFCLVMAFLVNKGVREFNSLGVIFLFFAIFLLYCGLKCVPALYESLNEGWENAQTIEIGEVDIVNLNMQWNQALFPEGRGDVRIDYLFRDIEFSFEENNR